MEQIENFIKLYENHFTPDHFKYGVLYRDFDKYVRILHSYEKQEICK